MAAKPPTFAPTDMKPVTVVGVLPPGFRYLASKARFFVPLPGDRWEVRKEVRDLMLELKDAGKTVFFSTHILGDVETIRQVRYVITLDADKDEQTARDGQQRNDQRHAEDVDEDDQEDREQRDGLRRAGVGFRWR